MQRLPALIGHDAAGGFQSIQPAPAVEGDGVSPHQSLPVLLRNLLDRPVPASGERIHGGEANETDRNADREKVLRT